MKQFQITIPKSELNFGATVTSGMMFRWRFDEEKWIGHDGPDRYEVRVTGDRYDVRTTASQEEFENLFRLNDDTDAIANRISSCIANLEEVRHHRNIRLLAPNCVTETTLGFLCSANNTLHRIVPMVHALAGYGDSGFPTFEQVAAIPEAELRAKGFGYRARTIPRAAAQILEHGGEVWLGSLKREPYSSVHQSLLEIEGIGPKLADCIALFALHHTEAVPIDTHVWQQLQPRLRPEWNGLPMTNKKGRELADQLRDFCGKDAGWAQQWLFFHGLSQGPARGMVQSCS